MKTSLTAIALAITTLTACQPGDSNILAQVGEEMLTVNDVLLKMPLTCTGADSVLFVERHVNSWVNEQLLYQQGLRSVPDLDQIEREVAQYRRDLIVRTYQAERMAIYGEEVTEAECAAFYEKNKSQFHVHEAILRGILLKVPANVTQIRQLKDWIKQINSGDMEHAEEFEQYCQLRAADYDNCLEQWVKARRLTDRLPAKSATDPRQYQRNQVYQLKDDEFVYLFLINDYRVPGEVKPLEYCMADVQELLIMQKQENFRQKLEQDLRDEALRTGLLKLKQ